MNRFLFRTIVPWLVTVGTLYLQNLLYVAYLFVAIAVGVIVTLFFREEIFRIFDKLPAKLSHKASTYALSRRQIFIHGLSPLCIVLTQHAIQYAVIGIPGAFFLSTPRCQMSYMVEAMQAANA